MALAPPTASRADNGTVHRVLRLLQAFASKDRWGLNELSRELALPRATTHRLLNLCKQLDFIEQDVGGSYLPGLALYRFAGRLASDIPLNRVALPVLNRLRDLADETALLTVLDRNELKMFFPLVASPPHPMRYTIPTNRLEPLSWGATGRCLLAFLSPSELEQVIERAEPSPLDGRPLDPTELRVSLEQIRRQGHAVTRSQRTPDACGLAVPFFDAHGEVRGNVSLTVPEYRYREEREVELLGYLHTAATEVASQLGWSVNQAVGAQEPHTT